MRLIVLTAIVIVLTCLALVRPRIGIYGYVWFTLLRPDVLAYAANQSYFSTMLAVGTAAGSIIYVLRRGHVLLRNRICLALLAFVAVGAVTASLAIRTSDAWIEYLAFFKPMAILLLIPLLLETKEQVATMLVVCAASAGFLGVKYGVFGLINPGIRFNQGYGSGVMDNNFVALLFAGTVPLCWYAGFVVRHKIARLALWGTAFATVIGVILTYSRGGALALGCSLFLIAWRSKNRFLMTALVLLTGVVPAVYLAGNAYLDRLSTINATTTEKSAESRLTLIKIGLSIWEDFPIHGVGFGRTNQQNVMPVYYPRFTNERQYGVKVLHNSYVQLLASSGLLGFVSFMVTLGLTILDQRRSIRKASASDPVDRAVPMAFQTSLISVAIGAFFLSATENFFLWYIVMLSSAAWTEASRVEALEPGAPLTTVWQPPHRRQVVAQVVRG